MKKTKKYMILTLAGILSISCLSSKVLAVDYAADEAYYASLCSGLISPKDENYQICQGYKQYLLNKKYDLEKTQGDLQNKINEVKANIQLLSAQISEFLGRIAELTMNIESLQNQIKKMNENLEVLEVTIQQKEEDIQTKKEYIVARMRSAQYQNTVNPYLDFIMGATNFIDMLNRVSIISQLDKADKNKMDELEKDIQALEENKVEVERQKELIEAQKIDMDRQLEEVETYKNATESLRAEFESQEALLMEQMTQNQSYIDQIAASIPAFTGDIPESSAGFSMVVSGYKSAGTWAYPSGSFHAGMDIAGNVGDPIYAPFNAKIVMTHDGEDTYNSWGQGLFGGGNVVIMVGQVNGRTYALELAHMQKGSVMVSPNQVVSQGQQVGRRGSSGYSTGPHTHIELYDCGNMSIEEAYNQLRSGYYFFRVPLNYSGSCEARGYTPCRLRPENFIPY